MSRTIRLRETIKKLMDDKSISARKLSSACKIPQSSLLGILSSKNGKTDPRYLDSIATYFGVSIEFLLFGSEKQVTKLQNLKSEKIFNGYLKVNIERVIPED